MAKMLRNHKVEAVLRPQQKPYDMRLLMIIMYTTDLDAELAEPSYICHRCFGLFKRYRRQQFSPIYSMR